MKAFLVWDGGDSVRVPPSLGAPLPDQLTGTPGEQLIEIGTRACYDSLGRDDEGNRKGRSTANTLKNVLDVKHFSVLEHYARTFELAWDGDYGELLEATANRPGIFTRFDGQHWRITANVRAVIEWDTWSVRLGMQHFEYPVGVANAVGAYVKNCMHQVVPLLVGEPDWHNDAFWGDNPNKHRVSAKLVEPETNAERMVSMFLVGSRGFSHEMVRHRFAISQCSTRYCAEDTSPWHWHPLIDQYLDETDDDTMSILLGVAQDQSQQTYRDIVEKLEVWLLTHLPEDTPYRLKTARKQARGAARGFLGNALETQMVFSAPVWAWKHIAHMRAADAADAEIREIIADAVRELKTCRYAPEFADLDLGPASDGIGRSLVSGGHA